MSTNPHLGDFVNENKKLAKEYFDIRIELLRLQLVRTFSKSAGYFIWTVISMFLLLLFMIFLFLVIGFWLAEITGSILIGFAVTLLIILLVAVVMTLLRRILFVNPIIRNTIRHFEKTNEENNKQKNGK